MHGLTREPRHCDAVDAGDRRLLQERVEADLLVPQPGDKFGRGVTRAAHATPHQSMAAAA